MQSKMKKKEKAEVVEVPEEVIVVATKPKVSKLTTTQMNALKMDPAIRARLDREKRATAAEARMRNQLNMCSACSRSLDGIVPFDKYQFRYCSTSCIKVNIRMVHF